MKRSTTLACTVLALTACTEIGDPALMESGLDSVPSGPLSFDEHVAPILDRRCASCHSAGGNGEGGFDVSTAQTVFDGGFQGESVVPCNHEASLLWIRVDNGQMPQGGPPLTEIEIATIARWIDQGGDAEFDPEACPNTPLD